MSYTQEPLNEEMFVERYRDAVERLRESRTRRAALEGAAKHAREEEKSNQAALEKLLAGRDEGASQMPFTDISEDEATGTGASGDDDEEDGLSTALVVPTPDGGNGSGSRSRSRRRPAGATV